MLFATCFSTPGAQHTDTSVFCAAFPPTDIYNPTFTITNSRVLFRNLVLHTGAQRDDTSVAVLGPACRYMRFEGCQLLGSTG